MAKNGRNDLLEPRNGFCWYFSRIRCRSIDRYPFRTFSDLLSLSSSIKFRKYVAWYRLITVYNCITTYYLEFLYSFDILVAFNMRLTTIPLNRFQKSLDENQIKTIDFCIRFFYFALFGAHYNTVTCKIRNLALAGRKSGQKWKTFLSTEAPSHNSSD